VCGAQQRPLLMYMFLNEVKFDLRMSIMLFTCLTIKPLESSCPDHTYVTYIGFLKLLVKLRPTLRGCVTRFVQLQLKCQGHPGDEGLKGV